MHSVIHGDYHRHSWAEDGGTPAGKTLHSFAALSSTARTLGVELSKFFQDSAAVWQAVRKGRGAKVADRRAKVAFQVLSKGRGEGG